MSVFNALFRSRDKPKPQGQVGGGWWFPFGRAMSGKYVSEVTAMQTSAVYACVRIISEAIASLPVHIYKQTDNGKEMSYTHHLYTLLHDEPNEEMTSFVLRETLMSHLLLWGNAYCQIIRDGMGKPISLYPLLPNKMTVSRDSITNKIVYTYQSDSGEIKLTPDYVLHIPGLGFDGLIGYAPIAMAKNAVGLALSADEFASKFFANGATPSGFLKHPGKITDPERLREQWQNNFTGSNSHKVAVLEEGMEFEQVSSDPEKAQSLETRKFQIDEIARIFRVPPHLLADLEKATFSNIEQQSLEFVKYCLQPWVIRWEQSLQRALLLSREKGKITIRFNLDGLMRGDYKSRMEGYSIGVNNGFLSVNDVRALEEMNLLTAEQGGDYHFVNGSMVKLADVGAAYAKTETEVIEVNGGDTNAKQKYFVP